MDKGKEVQEEVICEKEDSGEESTAVSIRGRMHLFQHTALNLCAQHEPVNCSNTDKDYIYTKNKSLQVCKVSWASLAKLRDSQFSVKYILTMICLLFPLWQGPQRRRIKICWADGNKQPLDERFSTGAFGSFVPGFSAFPANN